MTAIEPGLSTAAEKSRALSGLIPVFSAALLVSAFLLFSVQPLFTKMILPKLGGTPAVWSVAMVFFQAVLLAGYAYAHFVATRLPFKAGALLHLTVTVVAFLWLPLSIASGWDAVPTEGGQAVWLVGLYAASIGVPFFAVSANGPLLQAWFSRTGHPHAGDPYFLYGASNIGSLVALLSYPVLFEPLFRLTEQSQLWTHGYVLLLLLLGGSALVAHRRIAMGGPVQTSPAPVAERATITAKQRLQWIALAFVPSALLVAVTAHISTDIAAAPFLWIVPLALFLSTFIFTFARKQRIKLRTMEALFPFLVFAVIGHKFLDGFVQLGVGLAANLAIVFVGSMICHGNLVKRRPDAGNLTEFYLWMSFGGVLGGIFTGLLAPVMFNSLLEYPLLLILVLAATSTMTAVSADVWKQTTRTIGGFMVPFVIVIAAMAMFGFANQDILVGLFLIAVFGAAIVTIKRTGALIPVAAIAVVAVYWGILELRDSETRRSFFGVFEIAETENGNFRKLTHGTTIHGVQRIRNTDGTPATGRPEPLSYYHDRGAMALSIAATREKLGRPINIGVIGLGAGSLACYAQPGDAWTFYEIDPEVVALARDTDRFGFVGTCAPEAPMVIGDARLTIGDTAGGSYDILIIDAFSSDAIPVHLLTQEAIETYRSKITEDGVLVFHISNRFLDLKSVLAAIADQAGLEMLYRRTGMSTRDRAEYRFSSNVAALATRTENFGPMASNGQWTGVEADGSAAPWTDDYSNIIAALLRKLRQSP